MIIRARLKASFHLLVIHSRHPALDAGSIPSRHPQLITPCHPQPKAKRFGLGIQS